LADLSELKAVITAGGMGTRLLPFSKEIPKEMSPVLTKDHADSVQVKPIIHAIFEQLYSVGIRDYFVVVGRGKRSIEEHFTPDTDFVSSLERAGKKANGLLDFYEMLNSSHIVFVNQPQPLGFGDAVLRARPYLDGEFLVHAGDTLVISKGNSCLERLRQSHLRNEADATILLQDVNDPRQFGVVRGKETKDGAIRISEAVEKPKEPKSKTAIMPIYIFKSSIFKHLSQVKPDARGEIQLTDAIQSMIESGKKVLGVKLGREELRLDIGSPDTLLQALRLSAKYLGK
jgi:UTP--glucose-1-phosphate uridylyltransferase